MMTFSEMNSTKSARRVKVARWLVAGFGLVLTTIVLAACGLSAFGSEDSGATREPTTVKQQSHGTATVSPTPTSSPEAHDHLTPTADPTLPAGYPETPPPGLPPKKATAFANHPTSAPTVKATLVAGINNWDRQGAGAASLFLVRNSWRGPVAGQSDPWFLVYAGATKRQPEGTTVAGALRIYTISPETFHTESVGTFTVPTPSPLTIESVENDMLHLRTDDGAAYTFDLQTLKFVSP